MTHSDLNTFWTKHNYLDARELEEIYKLRKLAFIDRRKWAISSYKGGSCEQDMYDDSNAHYIISYYKSRLMACVRLRPMRLENLFQGELQRYFPPQVSKSMDDVKAWEATRFTVSPELRGMFGNTTRGIDIRTIAVFKKMIEFAIIHNFDRYFVIVDNLMLKILTRAGWELVDIALGNVTIDEPIYAGYLECNNNTCLKIGKRLNTDEKSCCKRN